jgi:adenylate cyclase
MGIEIERKFLVDPAWTPAGPGTLIRQGYLCSAKERLVRVRIAGPRGFITVKGPTAQTITRHEFEYEIPLADAVILLDQLCERPLLEKTRHHETIAGSTWEIDVFHGDNNGLIVAEIELEDPQQTFERPHWLGREVSDDPRYLNVNLVVSPFARWGREQS